MTKQRISAYDHEAHERRGETMSLFVKMVATLLVLVSSTVLSAAEKTRACCA